MYMAQRNEGLCDMNIAVLLRVVGLQESPQIGVLYKRVVICIHSKNHILTSFLYKVSIVIGVAYTHIFFFSKQLFYLFSDAQII